MKLFLDDIRTPWDCAKYMHRRIGSDNLLYLAEDWVIVRDYDEFVKYIEGNKLPDLVSFDHDLADAHYDPTTWTEGFKYKEKTGADCAQFLVDWCGDHKAIVPKVLIHSMNPVGCEVIRGILSPGDYENYKFAY